MKNNPKRLAELATDAAGLAGLGCLVGAAAWIYPPAGLVVLGVFLAGGAVLAVLMRNQP